MIKLRPKPEPAPTRLISSEAKKAKARVRRQVAAGEKKTFPPIWLKHDVRGELWEHHDKKCCYCERYRDETREPDIEHFRPKGAVAEDGAHKGYWWLAYSWANLFFSCKTCNQAYKKNQFPLLEGGVRARQHRDALSRERPALLDPVADDPEVHLHYYWEGGSVPLAKVYGSDQRGRETVRIAGLDREALNDARGRVLLALEGLVEKMHGARALGMEKNEERAAQDIRRATSSAQEFAGFRRDYFKRANLGEFVSTD